MHNPYCDGGYPGEGGLEATKRRCDQLAETAKAEQELLCSLDRPKPISYIVTHGPWHMPSNVCVGCGQLLATIYAKRLRCQSADAPQSQ